MVCLTDTIDFPSAFLGAIKAGLVPVAVNTLLTSNDYDFMLRDSRAQALIVSEPLLPVFKPILDDQPFLKHVVVSGGDPSGYPRLADLMAPAAAEIRCCADTRRRRLLLALFFRLDRHAEGHRASADKSDSNCRALRPADSRHSGERRRLLRGQAVLRLRARQRAQFSAFRRRNHGAARRAPDAGFGLPHSASAPADDLLRRADALQRALGEPRAAETRGTQPASLHLGRRGAAAGRRPALARAHRRRDPRRHRFDRDAAHLPIEPARRGALRHDGQAGAGLRAAHRGRRRQARCQGRDRRAADRRARPAPRFTGTTATKSRNTFHGPWTRSGDKYIESEDGYYTYCGRTDDMLKVGGICVSPFEVEAALASHEAVLEAAVVGQGDENELIKPKAFVVLRADAAQTPELAAELQQHVKSRLAPYKYPRWIEFVPELPKTATGKIQRFKLRAARST